MFSKRLDSLMNIAEVSNSQLGRHIAMSPSYVSRLRTGARPLPKRHDFLTDVCLFLAKHFKKGYQLNALKQLTGIDDGALGNLTARAAYLERWLLGQGRDTTAATDRLIAEFSRLDSTPSSLLQGEELAGAPSETAPYLFGNEGKRQAVVQFFNAILQEEKPQTLLLYSSENMAWLYEDEAFAKQWLSLFTSVLRRGNRVRIIHTVSRNANEMLEAVTKWIPVYLTGMIEPYCLEVPSDKVSQRTLFLAPNTAAVVSASVQQEAGEMLNIFLTDQEAIGALVQEFENYLSLSNPLMSIYSRESIDAYREVLGSLIESEGDACLFGAMPPLFALPEGTAHEMSERLQGEALLESWEQSRRAFLRVVENQRLALVLLEPERALLSPEALHVSTGDLLSERVYPCSEEQYQAHIENVLDLEKRYEHLSVHFLGDMPSGMLLYIEQGAGVVMVKESEPALAFVVSEKSMVDAFWDYFKSRVFPGERR